MKTMGLMLFLGISGVLATWGIYQCCLSSVQVDTKLITTDFDVRGMTCGGCEVGVRMAVNRLDGISAVKASHEEGRASVTYDPARVKREDIIKAIEQLGYKATAISKEEAQ